MKIVMLPYKDPDPLDVARIERLQVANAATCETCGKRFTKGSPHLTAGQIGWTHECITGHKVNPMEART